MKNVCKIVLGITVGAAMATLTGCCVRPDVGYESVLVKKPLIFGHGGIDPVPVKTGLAFVAPTTDHIDIKMQPLQADLDMKDIMTGDGTPLEFDAVIRIQVLDSVKMITKFGSNWYKDNVEKEFYKMVRSAVKKHGLNETAINPTATDSIDAEVELGLKNYLVSIDMPARILSVTVGKANPPDLIKHQRIETAMREQQIITEGQRKLAEDARKAAEESRAQADNAYRNAMSMSPEQYLQLEAIKMQDHVCSTGAKCTFISNGGKVTPIIDGR